MSSREHTALGTGRDCTICKMLLFLMTNEIVRGVSVSPREHTVLQGGSILTVGVWLALLTTDRRACSCHSEGLAIFIWLP